MDKIHADKMRLQTELDEAQQKINMLKLRLDGGCGKSEWEAFQKKFEKQGAEHRKLNRARDTLQRKSDGLERHNERLQVTTRDLQLHAPCVCGDSFRLSWIYI